MNSKKLLFKYLFFDVLASLLVWLAFVVFRKTINDIQIMHNFEVLLPSRYYLFSLIFFPFCCVFIHYLTGFYSNLLHKPKINLFLTTLISSLIISVAVFFALKLRDVIVSYEYFYYSLLVLFLQLFVITYTFRRIIYSQVQHNFKTKKWTLNTIIIGDGQNAQRIARDIEKHGFQYTFTGFVALYKKHQTPEDKLLGSFYDIESIINRYDIKEVIVALESDTDDTHLFKIINQLYKYNVDISFTPRLYEILTGSARISSLGINPLVSITQLNMPDWQISLKRCIDFISAFVALILLSPLFIYFAIRIKHDSNGPVFYVQERIGRFGKPFNMVKFRTMYVNSENGTPQLSSAFDDRITPFGSILRKYRIDELPQFWNVLKGDMSLVGPRPERQYYIDRIIKEAPYYCLLYKIRPGLTSWGPIKIGYSDTIEKMIERLNYDIIYIESMSLLNDLKILLLTIEIIFKGKGV
ncbi:MAG: sugar transferase [Paludibacter sp.]|nr:sugar transferase [Paludibacter sp.]MDD4198369.1 sugar transferase [Paludibacter sp.]MDD4428344.1 sugar transferase [Paludibacter sp.]